MAIFLSKKEALEKAEELQGYYADDHVRFISKYLQTHNLHFSVEYPKEDLSSLVRTFVDFKTGESLTGKEIAIRGEGKTVTIALETLDDIDRCPYIVDVYDKTGLLLRSTIDNVKDMLLNMMSKYPLEIYSDTLNKASIVQVEEVENSI